MRIAFLSDIHSNHIALEQCLEYIYDNDFYGIAFLGDILTDCPFPGKTLDLIKNIPPKYRVWHVRGNREDYLIDHHRGKSPWWNYSSSTGSLLYTYENTGSKDIHFFESLPVSRVIRIDGCDPFTICHGSPEKTDECLFPESSVSDYYLEKSESGNIFCAHTHIPFCYKKYGKRLINCGSVGYPVNSTGNAFFVEANYSGNKWCVKNSVIPYDTQAVISEFQKSDIMEKARFWARAVIKLLLTGENYPVKCLRLASDIAKRESNNTQVIPTEKHWEKAALILEL